MAIGAALRPIAAQGRSHKVMHPPVGAALCRDGLQSSPGNLQDDANPASNNR